MADASMGMNDMAGRSYWDRLIALEGDSENLTHRLYGNGQPGDIQQIKSTLEDLKRGHARMQGAIYVMGVVMPIILMLLQKFIISALK